MEIKYKQCGDYLIPDIELRKQKPIGRYGRMRKEYLKEHRPIILMEEIHSRQ